MIRVALAASVVFAIAVAGFYVKSAPYVHAAESNASAEWIEETATPADEIRDSIGINVHLNYPEYFKRYKEVKELLQESGIRHVRTSLTYEDPGATMWRIGDLGKVGIKTDLVFDSRTSDEQLRSLMQQAGSALETVEGTNEYDLTNRPGWEKHVIAYQKRLYAQAHALSIPVIGPALTSSGAYEKVGNLQPYLDFGNMHNYFSGFNPGTAGWGGAYHGDLYGSLAYNVRVAKIVSGEKPIVSTETGYCTLPNTHNAVTPGIAARYLPRLYLEQWVSHVPRTFVYELVSEGQPGCDSNLGLLTPALAKTPGFTAVQTLVREVTHTGSMKRSARLTYRIQGEIPSIHHVLVQTAAHSLKLFVWNETPSWNVNDGLGKPVEVADRSLRLTVRAPWKFARKQAIADSGELHQLQHLSRSRTALIPVGDRVTIVELRDN